MARKLITFDFYVKYNENGERKDNDGNFSYKANKGLIFDQFQTKIFIFII